MYCPNCGKELLEGAKFCPDCGEKIESKKSEAVNAVAEEVETVKKETLDPFAEIEEQNAAPSQEKPEPAQPTPVNTVPPVATNPAPANTSFEISSNGKITSGKKGRTKFKDLSPKQKAIRFGIGGLLLLIGIIWIVSDGVKGSEKAVIDNADNSISDENENAGSDYSNNSISDEKTENYNDNIVKNESISVTGGVCFNTTIDEFIKDYNDHIAIIYSNNETYQQAGQSYIDSLIDTNSLKISDFEIYNEELNKGATTATVYKLNFNKVGIGLKRGSAGLYVYTDPNTKQIFFLDYLVSEELINASDQAKNHWLNEVSACIFAEFTDYNWTEPFYFSDNVIHIELYNSVERIDHLIVTSATKDSYYYEVYSNM